MAVLGTGLEGPELTLEGRKADHKGHIDFVKIIDFIMKDWRSLEGFETSR